MGSTARSTTTSDEAIRPTGDRALRLQTAGKHKAAIRLLAPLAAAHPGRAAIWGCLGAAHYEVGDWAAAAEAFRRVVELSPKSERGSLGLFHSLWAAGAEQRAFDEMRRFLTLADSDEYATLLHDLAVEGRLGLRPEPASAT